MEPTFSTETLSSNVLFHFTKERGYLEGIIERGFIPRYSKEDLALFELYQDSDAELISIGVPMVCFCDIPLSKVKNHISWYGGYGIGLEKNWGIKYGICPILYINPTSGSATSIINFHRDLKKYWEKEEKMSFENYSRLLPTIRRLTFFCKYYEGPFEHNGNFDPNKRFYDEREWRFIPDLLIENKIDPFIIYDDKEVYDLVKAKNMETLNQQAACHLPIDALKIKYIIVKSEEDIIPIIDKIQKVFGEQYSSNAIRRLTSRILTIDQIKQDF